MSMIKFEGKLEKVNTQMILRLPKKASDKLPSRGLVIVEGTINGKNFWSPLEPDGKKGHWMKIEGNVLRQSKEGENVKLEISPVKELPEPQVPRDLKKALDEDKNALELWKDITPLARWDWIRWINGTKNEGTRKIRIEKTLLKLLTGKRNACCFNRSECTDSEVSHRGVLLDSK